MEYNVGNLIIFIEDNQVTIDIKEMPLHFSLTEVLLGEVPFKEIIEEAIKIDNLEKLIDYCCEYEEYEVASEIYKIKQLEDGQQ